MNFETFDQSDEDTCPDKKDNENDNDKGKDNDKHK